MSSDAESVQQTGGPQQEIKIHSDDDQQQNQPLNDAEKSPLAAKESDGGSPDAAKLPKALAQPPNSMKSASDPETSDLSGGEMPASKDNSIARAQAVGLLSGLYCLFIILLAFVFEISVVVSPDIRSSKYDSFYIFLYLVAIAFIAYVQIFLLRYGEVKIPDAPKLKDSYGRIKVPEKVQNMAQRIKVPEKLQVSAVNEKLNTLTMIKNKATHSAPAAGSLYLRLGMIMFGVIGVIYYCLELFGCAATGDCTGSKVVSYLFGTIFMFAQMYFIFQNSKLTIHRFKHLGRLGCMHLVATNLAVWIRLIVDENFLDGSNETHLNETEWWLSADEQKAKFIHNYRVIPINCANKAERFVDMDCYLNDFKPLLTTAVIEYSLICAAVAFILWRNIGFTPMEVVGKRKQNFRVDCSSTIRGMFVGLVFAILTIISMVIFFIKVNLHKNLDTIWIFYMTDGAFYILCIGATVYASVLMRKLPFVGGEASPMLLLDDILLFVGLIGQLLFSIFNIVSLENVNRLSMMIVLVSMLRIIQVILQTSFILAAQRLGAISAEHQNKKPGRQLVIFLLIANLAFFLINTFESQKATLNPVMVEFYGKTAWAVIVHSAVPLTIFYRFHSSVCLAEIWKIAYRVKGSAQPAHV